MRGYLFHLIRKLHSAQLKIDHRLVTIFVFSLYSARSELAAKSAKQAQWTQRRFI